METYIVLTSPYSQVPVDSVQPVGITPVISTAWLQHSRAEVTLGLKKAMCKVPLDPLLVEFTAHPPFFGGLKFGASLQLFP